MEGRKNHVDVGILSVIKFGRSGLYAWAAKSCVWESNLTNIVTISVEPWTLTACHRTSFGALVFHRHLFYSVLWTRGHASTEFKYNKTCFLCLKSRAKVAWEHLSYAIITFPIISKCSCLLKSITFPLKNHLNLGFRDESLDTSQGKTRLCPVVTSKLRGGTIILVGSTSSEEEKKKKNNHICCL